MTPNPQPSVIAVQPAPCAFDLFKVTAAHTPPPKRISIAVPKNSPTKIVAGVTWASDRQERNKKRIPMKGAIYKE
ncbi:hypothetical protein GCM10027294_13520 [Marinactinospora endophytica]